MTNWEYKSISFVSVRPIPGAHVEHNYKSVDTPENVLATMGRDGWEAWHMERDDVGVAPIRAHRVTIYFKRQA